MKTTIQINGKDVEIELTPEQVAAIQAKTETKTLWKPKEVERYYYLEAEGGIEDTLFVYGNISDNRRRSIGNCYQTREEAQKVYDHKIAEQKLKEIIFEANDGWTPDWNSGKLKYMFYYDTASRKVYISNCYQFRHYPNWMYIKDRKTAGKIYHKHYDLLMQVYGRDN